MSLDADEKRSIERTLWQGRERSAVTGSVAGLALTLALGCSLSSSRPMQNMATGVADRGTCEGLYVQSIWKGEDISGPQCASYVTASSGEAEFDRRRVQKVCEQTQIRTILSGEASTRFTKEACAVHEPQYQQARLGRACQEASRLRRRIQEDMTPAQSAACKMHLEPKAGRVALRAAGTGPERLERVRWNNSLSSVGEESSDGPVTSSLGARSVSAAEERALEGLTCEDRYVESIWRGVDMTGGAECAAQVPAFRPARIQNVCDGAAVRSVRNGEPLPAFTAHACQSFFAARRAPADAAGEAVAADASGAPVPPDAPGLDEQTITATVDAHWRSIGRDCMDVAPRSSAARAGGEDEPAQTPVTVTIHVSASGLVRDVSARVRGNDALETCIERSVRRWVFPRAERDTEIGLPLVFVGEK